MDWNDLKILQALSRGGSVAAAARLLSVDASTVSRKLAALEDAVGARLVIRSGRELQWTPEGRLALATAERVDEQVTELGRSVHAAKTGVTGKVTVSCTPATLVLLSAIVGMARERFPELVVELSGQITPANLAKGEADIALRAFKPDAPDLVARRGVDVGWYVIAAASYAQAKGLPKTEEELRDHPVILYGSALRDIAGPRWLEDRSSANPRTLRLDTPDAVAYAAVSGVGIGVVPYPLIHGRSDLVRVFEDAVAWAHLSIVYHASQREAGRIRAVIDLLVEHFERQGHCYSGKPPARAAR